VEHIDRKGRQMGGNGANEQLVRDLVRHQSMLMNYITALVRNAADAEDIYQELSVRVLCNPHGPECEEKFDAWCRGIARNLALHYWRAKRVSHTTVDKKVLESIDTAFREAAEESDSWAARRTHLRECIAELPGDSRDVLKKRYWGGLKSVEIAERMRCSAEAVRMKLMRVRDLLRECVGRKILMGQQP
jgi:RNA polymerase sigma-70 factor (ECF subfamily)